MGYVRFLENALQGRRHKLPSPFFLPAGWNEKGTAGAAAATLDHEVEAFH